MLRSGQEAFLDQETPPIPGCLICCNILRKHGLPLPRNGEKDGIFQRLCSILNVHLSPSTWNFEVEAFPFCASCTKGIQQLVALQDKLELMKKDIDGRVQGVHAKLRESEYKVISTDLRVLGFRSQVLGGESSSTSKQGPLFQRNLVQPSYSMFSRLHNLSNTNPDAFPSVLPVYPIHELPNSQENFLSNPNSIMQPIYHQNSHSRPDNVGHIEVELSEFNDESSNRKNLATEDDSHDMFEDANDKTYCEPATPISSSEEEETTTEISKKQRNKKAQSSETYSKPRPLGKQFKSRQAKTIGRAVDILSKAVGDEKSSSAKELEYFTPLTTTNDDGKMFYENIEITKNERGYVCGMCGYNKVKGHTTVTLRKMKIHIKGIHFNAYKCHTCNRNFSTNDILNQHTKRVHIIGIIPCEICQKPISGHPSNINAHMWTHKSPAEKAESRALGLEPIEIVNYRNQAKNKKHLCPICGKLFSKPYILKAHIKTHTAPSLRADFKCSKCNKSLTSENGLRQHIQTHHEKDKILRWFLCSTCGKKFFRKKQLDHHITRKHKPKEHKCSICNKAYGHYANLTVHLKKHPPVEYYKTQCDACGLRLRNAQSLRDHRRSHHPDLLKSKYSRVTVDKDKTRTLWGPRERFGPFEIGADGKLSFENFEVSKLERGVSCLTCGSEFMYNESNNSHHVAERAVKMHIQAVHLGAYTCSYCEKSCKSPADLNAHMIKAHYIKKVECEACGMELEHKKYRAHLWSHKSPGEMTASLNSGEPIPSTFKMLKKSLARQVEENVSFECEDCPTSFPTPIDLDDHRLECHPKSIILQYRSNRLKMLGRDGKPSREELQHLGKSNGKSKVQRRKRKNRESETSIGLESDTSIESESEASLVSESKSESEEEESAAQSLTRKFRSRQSKNFQLERNPDTAIVSLNSLPSSLACGKDFRIISEELVSYVSSAGRMKLISLDPEDKQEDSSETDLSDSEMVEGEWIAEKANFDSEMDCIDISESMP